MWTHTLDHQLTVPRHLSSASAVVGVLPANAVVDLVHADCVLQRVRLALVVVDPPVKVPNRTETVTTQLQVVCSAAGATFTQVICALSMIGYPRVAIWHCHLRQRQSVKDGSTIVCHISQDHTFPPVEVEVELPLLPLDDLVL